MKFTSTDSLPEAEGLSEDLTAAIQVDGGFAYLLKGSEYWEADMGRTGDLTIRNDVMTDGASYPKDVFVGFFSCQPKAN